MFTAHSSRCSERRRERRTAAYQLTTRQNQERMKRPPQIQNWPKASEQINGPTLNWRHRRAAAGQSMP
ncbi:hypothetical protein KOW79_014820 [Hemibagrus wyckioides]|uniref:Uncharacterized protein n=1 Tax=Hemibagrus wyckioides TaxID=337641 RepID=A0A9D3NJG3_9TELE|nr:hypothetical protein KOW79_014820 [Hemibagrus wyckioides]